MVRATGPRRGASGTAKAVARPATPPLAETASGPAIRHSAGFTGNPATYFDVLEPAAGSSKPPMMLVHGGAHTGSCYLVTADGRPGWAQAFARQGYKVVVPDWPGCGRSGRVPCDALDGELVVAALGSVLDALAEPAIVMTHSMSGAYGWKLLEHHGKNIARLIGIAPSAPGNIQAAPIILDDSADAITVQFFEGASVLQLSRTLPYVPDHDFVDRKLIGAGTRFPRDHSARYAASLIAIPPRLVLERANIDGSQLTVGDFAAFAGKRVLVMTGTDDIDHPRAIDMPIVDWLNANGAKADFLYLGDREISGNGHMMMLEEQQRRARPIDLLLDRERLTLLLRGFAHRTKASPLTSVRSVAPVYGGAQMTTMLGEARGLALQRNVGRGRMIGAVLAVACHRQGRQNSSAFRSVTNPWAGAWAIMISTSAASAAS